MPRLLRETMFRGLARVAANVPLILVPAVLRDLAVVCAHVDAYVNLPLLHPAGGPGTVAVGRERADVPLVFVPAVLGDLAVRTAADVNAYVNLAAVEP